jgi:hypothetical protein
MAGPTNTPLYEYTLAPNHKLHTFRVDELRNATLVEPFPFTKGCPLLRVPGIQPLEPALLGTMLFDLDHDPRQEHPVDNPAVEARMVAHLMRLMRQNDAPAEQFERLGLSG